ncbi:Ankyrin repeat domain-containing protein SOWAHA [Liparis tanakae]|uniref:Ankyrin repeat domain-containing protein SOWAHA n=1 Tax=Liparis tanakae TaxID=230148 RepID=A0A4Z2G130_9TELE|nr:Ankyrin repeat domain-containing protein SOWAHA [Liparis tanakae]
MVLTRESVLSLLVAAGGQLKKSDLVDKFKASIDCDDPAEKERNKELFKTCVNKVAVVKEIHGVRYVVVRKIYQHLLDGDPQEPGGGERETRPPGGSGEGAAVPEPDGEPPGGEPPGGSGDNRADLLTPIERALQKSQCQAGTVKRMLSFEVQRQEEPAGAVNPPAKSKPYGLPLRGPPGATMVQIRKLKEFPDEPLGSPKLQRTGSKRWPSSGSKRWTPKPETVAAVAAASPQMRRSAKTSKAPEVLRDTSVPVSSSVPLEQAEHEWLVKCAAGLWGQVYGLLLRDSQLADKRDFMSGFTALHWAAKCGNSDMMTKIVDLSRRGGAGVDVNAKTHGGYTPLHIAALHDQEFIMAMLVRDFRADPSLRDNGGRRASHYLHKGISEAVRELLGKHRAAPQEPPHDGGEEADPLPGLAKKHSISRLFQPHGRRHRQRAGFSSPTDEEENREDGGFRARVSSDVFL